MRTAGDSGEGLPVSTRSKGRTMETVMAVGLASLVACSTVAVRNALVERLSLEADGMRAS